MQVCPSSGVIALVDYLAAVSEFQMSDSSLYKSWYATYIEEFRKLVDQGADPHRRENYKAIIAGDHDLKGPAATAIEVVLDTGLPTKWDQYVEAYEGLRIACDEGSSAS
jgi:hypothetical protein